MTKIDRTRQKGSGKKALRDSAIVAKALVGKSTTQIAEELDMSRQAVSMVLNSDEVKVKIKEIDAQLAIGIDDAIATVLEAVKCDYKAAYDLLKNFGSMKTTVDLNHNFPKPTVIERRDGSQVILGTDNDPKEEG